MLEGMMSSLRSQGIQLTIVSPGRIAVRLIVRFLEDTYDRGKADVFGVGAFVHGGAHSWGCLTEGVLHWRPVLGIPSNRSGASHSGTGIWSGVWLVRKVISEFALRLWFLFGYFSFLMILFSLFHDLSSLIYIAQHHSSFTFFSSQIPQQFLTLMPFLVFTIMAAAQGFEVFTLQSMNFRL